MYESFFGLTGLPFQLNPDPSFLFHGKGHSDAFAALRAGLAGGARVMVVTGEVGAGKTTLLQALLAGVDSASTVTAHISVSGLDADTLATRVLGALGQAPASDAATPPEALLAQLRSGPLATLLVIDEAQHLDPGAFELLEALASAASTGTVRLQICLVGQPELRFLINAPERSRFRELIDVDRHLRPLEQSEIRLYVEHRLHRAGWSGRPEFEDAAFVEIFIFTAGIPRRVNLLCNSLMLSAWLKRQERIDAPAVTRAAAALRGDASQAAPDLPEVGLPLEPPPTLTEAVEPDSPPSEQNAAKPELHPWSCPSCDAANPATLSACWKCDAGRPMLTDGAASNSDAVTSAHEAALPSDEQTGSTAVQADGATSGQRPGELPPLTLSDGTPGKEGTPSREPINARLAGLVERPESPGRRRRKVILASIVSVAAALAVITYVMEKPTSQTSLSPSTMRDVVVKQPATSPPQAVLESEPSTGAASLPTHGTAIPSGSPASALSESRAGAADDKSVLRGQTTQDGPADPMPGTTAATPRPLEAASPEPAASPLPSSCSGPASALGLCDAERSSSTRRQ